MSINQKIDFKSIGERIKERRNQLNMTQSDLAEKLGVTSASIGKIERGENVNGGSVDSYIKIAVILDLSLDTLFDIERQKPIISHSTKCNTIKDFIDFFDVELLNRIGVDSNASLLINDVGVTFYIQEYMRIIDKIDDMTDEELKEKARMLLVADLDKKVNDLMEFDGHSLVFKSDKNFHFEHSREDNKIVIVENEFPF